MRELASFLRTRRERLPPRGGGRRRTPGLRREEVAAAAGMSVDYLSRLEQARGPHPSAAVLNGLARALCLTPDERAYLFRLAGSAAPEEPPPTGVRPGLRLLLDRLQDDIALVITDLGDVLAWTRPAEQVFGSFAGRNLLRAFFLGPGGWVPEEDREDIARGHVADLRATLARRPSARPLVDDLMTSPLFARLWAAHDVAVRRSDRKRLRHPVAGLLELDCEVVADVEQDQRLVIHTAPAGSVTAQRLALLTDPPAPPPVTCASRHPRHPALPVSGSERAGRLPEPWTPVPVFPSSAWSAAGNSPA
ncbi:helix-turn-helix transcriptional regulator [Nocardia sp. NRRL S-836]|uniref:helix-turn-helix transcriptional regulator n=1 Tax=Nocardia sp. NRRL S-836 TaxID=1519492 RepID=UPI0007C8601F|nr:helix-turn-helix transcriptional regulator [Nocardia sp. NRRL S-836]